MIKRFNANQARLQRHQRMRNRLAGSTTRPRLNVFRSGHHIYAQIIDDTTGRTLVAASSLEEALRDFKPAKSEQEEQNKNPLQAVADAAASVVEAAANLLPGAKGRGAKAEKPAQQKSGQAQQKGAQSQQKSGGKGQTPGIKTVLPAAQKGSNKTPVEALAAIANNRKVATAREVGKLLAQRAKEQGVSRVVFDRGGYAYHGRVAALAEGAREGGLDF